MSDAAPPRHSVRDVIALIESIAPLDSGIPGDEQGLLVGEPDRPVRGVACLWNVQTPSLDRAVELGCDLLVVHESPFYAVHRSPWYSGPADAGVLDANRRRRERIERHGLAIYRIHSSWDALDGDGVPDQAVAALGLGELRVVGRQKFFKVHELPMAMLTTDLAEYARRGLGLGWSPRIFGRRDALIQRFAFLIGGFGGNQHQMPQAARDLGAQALIVGEMWEFIAIAALEMGLPVIETLHSRSEEPAIRRQAALLAAGLPGTPVHFIASGATAWP